jgi:hypothetical protein
VKVKALLFLIAYGNRLLAAGDLNGFETQIALLAQDCQAPE